MHLKGGKIAFLGLLAAICVLLVCLGSVLESNTLFLIGAASFCFGISIREFGFSMGIGFLIGTMALSFLLAGNKLYCITYFAMCSYIIFMEYLAVKGRNRKNLAGWLFFNCFFIPAVCIIPRLFFHGRINGLIIAGLIIAGQIVLFVYQYAYHWFINRLWPDLKRRFRF